MPGQPRASSTPCLDVYGSGLIANHNGKESQSTCMLVFKTFQSGKKTLFCVSIKKGVCVEKESGKDVLMQLRMDNRSYVPWCQRAAYRENV